MKAVCISACEVDRYGIVTPGEEVDLPDGLFKDPRINLHFVIDRGSVKDENAPVPDYEGDMERHKEDFARSLVNATEMLTAVGILMDEGIDLPPELCESGIITDEERIDRIVDMWVENFGYVFPKDMNEEPKKAEKRGSGPGKSTKRGTGNAAEESVKKADGTHEEDLFVRS